MKKVVVILIPVLVLVVLLITGGYFFGVFYFRQWYCPNTYINDVKVSGKLYEDAQEILSSVYTPNNISIVDVDGNELFINGEDIYIYDSTDSQKAYEYILKEESPFLWPYYVFNTHIYEYKPEVRLNEDNLKSIVDKSFVKDKDLYNESNTAEITYNKKDGYQFVDNTNELLDYDMLMTDITNLALNNGGKLDLSEADYYKNVNHSKEYEAVVKEWNAINRLIDFNMDYVLASGEVITIDSSVVSGFLAKDEHGELVKNDEGDYYIDSDKVHDYVQDMSDEYDNLYKTKYFKATRGDIVEIPYSRYTTYGNLINVDEETVALEELIVSGKSPETREPIYIKKEDKGSFYNDYGGTYVEIDMNNQTMYYYVDGEIKLETPVVTGCWSNGNMTPQAVCYIVNKATNIWLDGPGYHSFVYHWMCITSQIGIHDATWRAEGQFGGEIYRYGGSHGCINTPLQNMHELFEMMEIGTPVIVFE